MILQNKCIIFLRTDSPRQKKIFFFRLNIIFQGFKEIFMSLLLLLFFLYISTEIFFLFSNIFFLFLIKNFNEKL